MRAPSPEPRRSTRGRPLRPPADCPRSPSDSRRGSDMSQQECAIGLGFVTAAVHSRLPFGTYSAPATWRARDRSKLGTQPTTSHASAVTVTTTVYTWSPCSTSAGSRGGPSRLGCIAATSQEDRAFGLRVVAAVLSVHLRELHRVLDRVSLGAIEAWNPADEVTCKSRHRNHHGRHLVVLFDLRRDHSEDQRGSDVSQRRRRSRSRSVSVSSSTWCALDSSPGTAPRRTRGAYRRV